MRSGSQDVLKVVSDLLLSARRMRAAASCDPGISAEARRAHVAISGHAVSEFDVTPWFAGRLGSADLIWVSPEMVTVLLAAEPSMPEVPLAIGNVPWRDAVCLFASAVGTVPVEQAVLPGPFQVQVEGVQWTTSADYRTPKRDRPAALAQWIGRCPELSTHQFLPAFFTTWPEGDVPSGESDDPRTVRFHRLLACLWSMLQQRIAVRQRAQGNRQAARAIQRELSTPELPQVIEITLRRPTSQEESGEHRDMEWSHRWIVGGHWRNQYLPSTGDHRPTWIAPYVKGPDDKPLVVKDRVYAWKR